MPLRFGYRSPVLVAAALPCMAHCAAPIDAPSAFSGERYVCGPEHAAEFDALVEECRVLRQTSVCRGVLSLRGTIDSEDVTLNTRVASMSNADYPGDPAIAREIALVAPGPYFTLKFNMVYLAVPPLTSVSGALPNDCAAAGQDPTPCIIVNLEARGGNYLSATTNVFRAMELETAQEMRVSFTADLNRGGHIDGCFHLFALTSS